MPPPADRARRIVDTYADMVLRVCVSYVGSRADAEDITQETLYALYSTKQIFSSPEHEKAWTLRVAINRCKDLLHSAAYRTRAGEELLPEAPVEQVTELSDAIRALPHDQRVAIHLFYYHGYSAAEIADLTDSSRDAIYQRLHRARESLATTLIGESHA